MYISTKPAVSNPAGYNFAAPLREFFEIVAGRARVIPLLEDVAAMDDLDEILDLCVNDELIAGVLYRED